MTENQTRLIKGAKKLAEFWRSGQRCPTAGWSLRSCTCSIKTTFCGAKELWMSLMVQDPKLEERGTPNEDSEYGLIEMMRAIELETSELNIKTNADKLHGARIGPKGEMTVSETVKMMEDPDAVPPTLDIKHAFPGAEVQTVENIEEGQTPAPEEELV